MTKPRSFGRIGRVTREGQGDAAATPWKPIARSEDLIVERLDDEVLVYDLLTEKYHALNETSAALWELCDGSRTVEDLATFVGADDPSTGQRVVWLALKQLSERRLLLEPADIPEGTSRRELLRRVAIAGAVVLSVPLVRSINAPAAAQSATCLPFHAFCTSSAQCCSGYCHPSARKCQ